MDTSHIPDSISKIYDFFNKIENCSVKSMNPIPISALNESLFFNKEDIKNHMTFLWEVVETEDYFIWIIQSDKWDRKTWRNHFINKLQSNLATSILVFVPGEMEVNQTLEQYSMSIITMDGTLDFPSVVPEKPEESVLKIWEAIKSDTLSDILEFESQVACEKFRVTAESLYDILQNKNIDEILEIFRRAGHKIQDKYVFPKEDTILENAILQITDSRTIPKQVMKDYFNLNGNDSGKEVKWIISLTPESLTYFKKNQKIQEISLEFPKSKKNTKKDKKTKEKILNFLTSLVALISRRAAYNAEIFAFQYGEYSLLYFYTIQSLRKLFEERKEAKLNVIFQEWQRRFEAVYRKGDTTEELFLKHTYLGLLIRLVLYVVYFPKQKLKTQSIIEMTSWLEERGFSLFTYDFFSWGLDNVEILELLYAGLKPFDDESQVNITRIFEADDLFRTIYQQMVSPSTRLALGEFYTPPELARIMIEDSYKFGQVVLDPACGSGTFLIEIIRKIKSNTDKSIQTQLNALKNVYGFDVNPIAVATSKANILMHLKDLIEEHKDLSTNIFLSNSLFPIELNEFEDIEFGQTLEFKLPTINETVALSSEFFLEEKQESFGHALSLLDSLMTKNNLNLKEFKKWLNDFLSRDEFKWMEKKIGSQDKTLKDNFKKIALRFYQLSKDNKDHIWIFLLYNSLGPYMLRKKADLIIGNPPWLVLHNIHSENYKEQVKTLAKDFNILPEAQSISHLEMSALFLYMSKKFLKDFGRVFFIVSNAFVAGDNHDGTRQFLEFEDIKFWKFTKDIFNIHNICLSAKYHKGLIRSFKDLKELEVTTHLFAPRLIKSGKIIFSKIKEEKETPYKVIERTKNNYFVKKLLPLNEIKFLLPEGTHAYKNLCYNGATLFPRNLIFVKIDAETEDFYEISPLIENPKDRWDFDPKERLNLKKIMIEKKYIFLTLKSLGVGPFIALKYERVFLPIEINEKGGYKKIQNQETLGWNYFKKLSNLYKNAIKTGARIKDLWENINYQEKLTKKRQRKQYKVVMMSSGTIAKACLVKDPNIIIDYTNFIIGFDSEDDAYYLMAYLNAPSVTKTVQFIQAEGAGGKGRHITKRPFLFKFPKFNPKNLNHQKIVKKSKEMESKARKIADEWIKSEKEKHLKKGIVVSEEDVIKPLTIQNRIYKQLGWDTKKWIITDDFEELDNLVREVIFEGKEKENVEQRKGLFKYI
ncbi:MAG: N-6 DNA methylase [Candidatus Helarchaeota archaeon]